MAWAFALPCMWRLQRGTAQGRGKEARTQKLKGWEMQKATQKKQPRENQVVKRSHKKFAKTAESVMAVKKGLGSPSAQNSR